MLQGGIADHSSEITCFKHVHVIAVAQNNASVCETDLLIHINPYFVRSIFKSLQRKKTLGSTVGTDLQYGPFDLIKGKNGFKCLVNFRAHMLSFVEAIRPGFGEFEVISFVSFLFLLFLRIERRYA